LSDKDCGACGFEWSLWTRIIRDCEGAWYGFWALELMAMSEEIELFGNSEELRAWDYEALKAVRGEINRRRAYRAWLAGEPKS
jgi:hypothetical protein